MMLGELFSGKRLLFIALFTVIALAAYQINFSALVGDENQFFTLFQLLGPIAGAFLGPVFGAASVLGAELLNFVFAGKELGLVNIARLAPMLFAAFYFGTSAKGLKGKFSIAVPLAAMALFVLHPVGQQAWMFSLFWLIPVAMKVLPGRIARLAVPGILVAMFLFWAPKVTEFMGISPLLIWPIAAVEIAAVILLWKVHYKSLGATFSAHAVGGAIWAWTVPMTPAAWLALIPIVAFERMLFSAGISVSYVVFNTVLAKAEQAIPSIAGVLNIDKAYVISKRIFARA